MVRLVVVVAAIFAAGCFEDRYRCTSDSQCDVGEGGRCETTGYCTAFDLSCTTQRRYANHSGALSNTCFDDRAIPANACAEGQGPALPEGCFADVCARLPACCEIAWTEACVQVAQEECDLACDTRIAITATRGMTVELWDLRRPVGADSTWTIERITELQQPLTWFAPAPGTIEPRLGGTMDEQIVVGSTVLPTGPGRTYYAMSSIAFDRDTRDTISAGYTTADGAAVELWKLDDQSLRSAAFAGAQHLTWGDLNRDAFPDAIARNGGAYSFLENRPGDNFTRRLLNTTVSNMSGGGTPGTPAIRAIDWLDFNRDGALDLVVMGSSVRIHTNADALRDVADGELDCIPPSFGRECEADPEPDLEASSFTGCALPTRDEPSVLLSVFPGRKLFKVRQQGDANFVTAFQFPGQNCSCQENCNAQCPGANCSCTYDCNTCVPVLALTSRDLDGDRRLDLVAIDGKLNVYTALAAGNYAWSAPTAIPTASSTIFFTVNLSVSGAPTP